MPFLPPKEGRRINQDLASLQGCFPGTWLGALASRCSVDAQWGSQRVSFTHELAHLETDLAGTNPRTSLELTCVGLVPVWVSHGQSILWCSLHCLHVGLTAEPPPPQPLSAAPTPQDRDTGLAEPRFLLSLLPLLSLVPTNEPLRAVA